MERTQWDDLDDPFSKCEAYLKSWSLDAVEYGQTPNLVTLLAEFDRQLSRLKVTLAATELPKTTARELSNEIRELNNVVAIYQAVPPDSACDPARLVEQFARLKRFVKARTGGGD